MKIIYTVSYDVKKQEIDNENEKISLKNKEIRSFNRKNIFLKIFITVAYLAILFIVVFPSFNNSDAFISHNYGFTDIFASFVSFLLRKVFFPGMMILVPLVCVGEIFPKKKLLEVIGLEDCLNTYRLYENICTVNDLMEFNKIVESGTNYILYYTDTDKLTKSFMLKNFQKVQQTGIDNIVLNLDEKKIIIPQN